jgi:tryptophanyl-tRNA synthetase
VTNLLRIYSALSGEPAESIAASYGDSGYGKFKKDLGELVAGTFAPIRERTAKILADADALDGVLLEGARRARAITRETMVTVRDRCGLPPVA